MKKEKPDTNVCHEIEIHYKRPVFDTVKTIKHSHDTDKIVREFINLNRIDYKEFFIVLLLTTNHQVLYISEIGSGDTTNVVVHVKEIAQLALMTHSSAVIVAHNHPSGRLYASGSDIKTTIKIKNALSLFDINLLDHIIITSEGYFSFVDYNITPFTES